MPKKYNITLFHLNPHLLPLGDILQVTSFILISVCLALLYMLNIYPYIIYDSIYKNFLFFFILFLLMVLVILCLHPEVFYLMTDGSGSGGGLTPGGGNEGPSAGGPNGPGPEVVGGGLPHSDTQGSLNSNISYSSSDLKNAAGAETINVQNILHDKTLTPQERNDKVLRAFAECQNKLIDAKKEIAILKKQGEILIGISNSDR